MKKSLTWIGSGLGLLGLAFVALKLVEYAEQIDLGKYSPTTWSAIATLSLIYGFASICMAFAWRHVLRFLNLHVNLRWAVAVYGTSQLAKYVPSNIFQFAGRQVLGTAAGLPTWPLLKSVFWELASLASAGALLGALALPALIAEISIWMAVALYGVAAAVAFLFIRNLFGKSLALAWLWHSAFLLVAGCSFVVVLRLVTGTWLGEISLIICGAYLVAWLAGLVTPGAPAGVGVREIVLYALLHTMVDQADLITAIVLGRIVTVCGDVVFYLIATGIQPGKAMASAEAQHGMTTPPGIKRD